MKEKCFLKKDIIRTTMIALVVGILFVPTVSFALDEIDNPVNTETEIEVDTDSEIEKTDEADMEVLSQSTVYGVFITCGERCIYDETGQHEISQVSGVLFEQQTNELILDGYSGGTIVIDGELPDGESRQITVILKNINQIGGDGIRCTTNADIEVTGEGYAEIESLDSGIFVNGALKLNQTSIIIDSVSWSIEAHNVDVINGYLNCKSNAAVIAPYTEKITTSGIKLNDGNAIRSYKNNLKRYYTFGKYGAGINSSGNYNQKVAKSIIGAGNYSITGDSLGGEFEWSIAEGCLNIDGEGALKDYSSYPWDNTRLDSLITSVKYGDGITEISPENKEIKSLSLIKKVSFGCGMQADGFHYNCPTVQKYIVNTSNSSITSASGVVYNKTKTSLLRYPQGKTSTLFEIPRKIDTVGCGAFDSCMNLKKVSFPAGMNYIEDRAFNNCINLKTVSLGSYVKEIGNASFPRETAIKVNSKNKFIGWKDGVLLTKDGTCLISYPISKTDDFYRIPEGVKVIRDEAFSKNPYINGVIIPASVEELGRFTFADCPSLNGATFFGEAYDFSMIGTFSNHNDKFVIEYNPEEEGWDTPECHGVKAYPFNDYGSIYPKSVEFSSSSLNISLKASPERTLNYSYSPEQAYTKNVKVYSSNSNVAEVTHSLAGKEITVLGKQAGSCKVIMLFPNGTSFECEVVVSPEFEKDSDRVFAGEYVTNKLIGATGTVVWSSSNKKVATVSSSGKVKGRTVGFCEIRAKYKGVVYKYELEVRKPIVLNKTAILGITAAGTGTSVEIEWVKTEDAEKYLIYRATSSTGSYKMIAEVDDNTYKDDFVKPNKKYYYKIKCSAVIEDRTYISGYSPAKGTSTAIKKPSITSATGDFLSATLQLEETGVTGYAIYRSTNFLSGYKMEKTTENSLVTVDNLTCGSTYYFKVKSYVIVDGEKYYSNSYSSYVKVKTLTPTIGVTSSDGWANYGAICNSISLGKGATAALPVVKNTDEALRTIKDKEICAIVIPGGGDIMPSMYGEEVTYSKESEFREWKDISEIAYFKAAMQLDLPVLGICRGGEMVNVASGGALIQDILKEEITTKSHSNGVIHNINIMSGTLLHDVMETDTVKVNSYHHQAVDPDRLGKNIIISAVSPDGVVEAVERSDKTFVMGLVSHPEQPSMRNGVFGKLFKRFVKEAALYGGRNN